VEIVQMKPTIILTDKKIKNEELHLLA